MSINPTNGTGPSHNWNHTNKTRDDYSLELVGTVLYMQEIQSRKFSTHGKGEPEFWPEGNPKMKNRIVLITQNGTIKTFTFQKATNRQKQNGEGIHMALFNLSGGNCENLVGHTIRIWTEEPMVNPATGQQLQYGKGYPRPYYVEELQGVGPFQPIEQIPAVYLQDVVYCEECVQGGRIMPPIPANIAVPQVPQQSQQLQQQMQPQQQYQPQRYQQPQQQPQQQYQQQYVQPAQPAQPIQPVQPALSQQPAANVAVATPVQNMNVPQGMDPLVAQAMQTVGVNPAEAQPVIDNQQSVYDSEIPF